MYHIKRKGFTLIEAMFAIIVLSIIMISVYGLYAPFQEIKEQVEAKAKLKNFQQIVSNGLYDIKRVKQMLKSSPLVDNNSTSEEGVSYFDNTGTLVSDILVPNTFSIFKVDGSKESEALQNFFNVNFSEDPLFYRNLFYTYTTVNEKLFGEININYKKFTFVHVNDGKFSTYIKNLDLTKSTDSSAFNELFNTSGDFLVIKDTLNDKNTTITNAYVKDNWKQIRKKINVIKFTTRDQVYEPIKHIKTQMEESQKKIVDWATIQARYEAHKSVSTGNNLNTDYFITCSLISSDPEYCNDTIKSVSTLIKLDSGTSINSSNRVNIIDLNSDFVNANTSYGFLVINGSTLKSSTKGCEVTVNDNDGNSYVLSNSLNLTTSNTLTTYDCKTSNGMSNLIENFNTFGYPILFSNSDNPYVTAGISISSAILAGQNRFPTTNVEAPYNATLYTILPNNAIITKKLYGHLF